MPIESINKTKAAPENDKSAKVSSFSTDTGGGGRSTFRPPWVKADLPEEKPKTAIQTGTALSKKTVTTAFNNIGKRNRKAPPDKFGLSSSSKLHSKTAPLILMSFTDAAACKEAKQQSREIKVPIVAEIRKLVQKPLMKPTSNKSSSTSLKNSDNDDDEDHETDNDDDKDHETETISESEEDSSPQEESENELDREFQETKPKTRPIVVNHKSISITQKKPQEEDNANKEEGETEADYCRRIKLERLQLRHVVVNKQKPSNKSFDDFDQMRKPLRNVQKVNAVIKEAPLDVKPEFKDKVLRKVMSINKDTKVNVPAPPPLPNLAPRPPPPPDFEKKNLTQKQRTTIENLKTRPRRRPDWLEMMKEVEDGKKLRHVLCNDRSQPIITCKSITRVDDKFVYKTEKDNGHSKLLKQIQSGVRLKSVTTNDRSKPFLDGLRKFRRQMTIEEQIKKSESKANLNELSQGPDEPSGDELDDIDKLRDDLQSTKQMLAIELRNREAQERENKRLLAKIANLEAEMQRDNITSDKHLSLPQMTDDVLVQSLKKEAEDARETSKVLEKKYAYIAEQYDAANNEAKEQRKMIMQLEIKLSRALQGGSSMNGSRRRTSESNPNKENSPELELLLYESEEDDDDEKKTICKKRRFTKELRLHQTRLLKLKDKQESAKKDRASLKEIMKKNRVLLREEKNRFKKLEKEVHKMAASMKEGIDDYNDEKDKDEEEEKEEKKEEAEKEHAPEDENQEEYKSEESEEETESETEGESDGALDEDKRTKLEPQIIKYENRLSAFKKGNVLLQANVDNLQDEISKVREKARSLQAELDAVLADLGM